LERLNATLKRPLSFGANVRIYPGLEFESIFSALKKANFRFIHIGLESGSEKLRREVLRRNYSNEDIVNAVRSARNHGLQVGFFNLIGVPGETFEDFKETVRMNRLCRPDWNFTYIFYPYPGTDLYFLCKKQGLLPDTLDPRKERERAVLDLPGFSRQMIEKGHRFFNCYVYEGVDPEDDLGALIFSGKRSFIRFLYRVYDAFMRLPLLRKMRPLIKKLLKNWIHK
jgi:radical SAM superfamily enzyme YgiQ (UPF0313 family)